MTSDRRLALILRLFPTFASPHQEAAFDNLLQTASIVARPDNMRTLPHGDRMRALARNQTWLREEIRNFAGRVGTIFIWAYNQELLAETSALQTLETFVREVRGVKKVLVVNSDLWPLYAQEAGIPPGNRSFEHAYQSVGAGGEAEVGTCYVLRLWSTYDLDDGRQLGNFAGTRRPTGMMKVVTGDESREPGSSPGTPLAALGVSQKPPRAGEEATVQVPTGSHPVLRQETPSRVPAKRPSQAALEIRSLPVSARPDPRAIDEDKVETIPPAPGEGPPEPLPPLKQREDPTQPR